MNNIQKRLEKLNKEYSNLHGPGSSYDTRLTNVDRSDVRFADRKIKQIFRLLTEMENKLMYYDSLFFKGPSEVLKNIKRELNNLLSELMRKEE